MHQKVEDMSFKKVNLTFNEYALKLMQGATLKFDNAAGHEFAEWFRFWYKDIVITIGFNPDEKNKMTIKL